jgi:hypothetical protein
MEPMRVHEIGQRQLEIAEFARFEQAQGVRAHIEPARGGKLRAIVDANVYGEDFALVGVRDGFYADDHRVYYVSRGRVFVVRSPRMRSGHGYRRISALTADAQSLDESHFDPDHPDDQALFAVADCIDGIE